MDAGTHDSIALHSRDEKSVLVVCYADLKTCLEKTFAEVLSSAGGSHSGPGADSHREGHGSNSSHAPSDRSRGVFKYSSS